MSIYNKLIDALATSDLADLLSEQAVENVRLEFKLQEPAKDETLKKLSAFANTFGGYMIVGAAADSDNGRLTALPGIKPVSGYKQRIIQWCQEGIAPPILPYVSDPLLSPQDSSAVCYVIFVEESIETPHFLNSRKGAYVRTDEFSQRFEARLATYNELVHLQNRRAEAIARRSRLLERAEQRFAHLVQGDYASHPKSSKNIGATLKLFIAPKFPAKPLIAQKDLLQLVQNKRLQWRSVSFPQSGSHFSQHETALIIQPAGNFSMFEASIWGHTFFATEIQYDLNRTGQGPGGPEGIHLNSFMGHLLVSLKYSSLLLENIGYNGTLQAYIRLERVRGLPWLYFIHSFAEEGPSSKLDDDITFSLDLTSKQLFNQIDEVVADLTRAILFALNWASAASDEQALIRFIRHGYEYNKWSVPASLSTSNEEKS